MESKIASARFWAKVLAVSLVLLLGLRGLVGWYCQGTAFHSLSLLFNNFGDGTVFLANMILEALPYVGGFAVVLGFALNRKGERERAEGDILLGLEKLKAKIAVITQVDAEELRDKIGACGTEAILVHRVLTEARPEIKELKEFVAKDIKPEDKLIFLPDIEGKED